MEFTDAVHKKFREEIRAVALRRTQFDTQRKAYFRFVKGGKSGTKRYLKGVHRTVAKAFGSLKNLIRLSGGGAANATNKGRSPTARGARVGRELCRWIAKGPSTPIPRNMHPYCTLVVQALKAWDIHLIDGELAVSHGHIATGIDLLGVKYHLEDASWHLVCIELKSGYRGRAWTKNCGGLFTRARSGDVIRSIKNYSLTQLRLTQLCAESSLSGYEFDPPLLIQVHDEGVYKSSPTPDIDALCKHLLSPTPLISSPARARAPEAARRVPAR